VLLAVVSACSPSTNLPKDASELGSADGESPGDAQGAADASVVPDVGQVAGADAAVHALYAKVPFIEAEAGLIVEVSFAGSPPALMRYDTGSPSTYLDRDFAQRAGLHDGRVDATIGGAAFHQRPLTLVQWPEAHITYPGLPGPIQGLVGNDFFEGFAVGVDHQGQLLWFTEMPSATDLLDRPSLTSSTAHLAPFSLEGGYLVVRCGFDSATDSDCLFDFGALQSLAFERVWSTFSHPDPHVVPFFSVDNQGTPISGSWQRARAVYAGDLRVPGDYVNVMSRFSLLDEVGASIHRTLAGLVGLHSTIGHFSVVDYANRRLLFFAYDTPPDPPSIFIGFGFVVGTSTDGVSLPVAGIAPLSDAEVQGVMAGDRLRAIDGVPLASAQVSYTLASIISAPVGTRKRFTFQRGSSLIDLSVSAEDLLPPLP
jgi:hypothetical protein